MAVTPQTYPLADGQTRLALRGLTLHADDAVAWGLRRQIDEFADVANKCNQAAVKCRDSKERRELVLAAAGLRVERDAIVPKFLKEYLRSGSTGDDIETKILPQLTDGDIEFLLRYSGEGPQYSMRLLDGLLDEKPITCLESLIVLLEQTDAGKAYLSGLALRLAPPPTSGSGPSATT